ncbi:profilin [Streptomyces sp. NBC_01353]|uniref:profilin n=1 Tax=Streptomyces sp. NBC_01353 TaxID=2903835 RepID=UPI002E31F39D|nr:profilin [Streptomyces sp. NBC_01353]
MYLQEVLGSGCVAQAEVLRMDGTVRTSTGPWLTTVQEGRRLASLFEAPADTIAAGITVGGRTYVAAQADRRLLHGKRGTAGVVAVRHPPFIVVALYGEEHRPADAVLAIGNLADLLASRAEHPDSPPRHPAGPQAKF